MNIMIVVVTLCSVIALTQAAQVGEVCSQNSDCFNSVEHSYCLHPYDSCTTGFCTCLQDYYHYEQEQSCRSKSTTFCQVDEDCSSQVVNTNCTSNACVCPSGHQIGTVDDVMYCYVSEAGEDCSDDDDCLTYHVNPSRGMCLTSGVCGCSSQYVLEGNSCNTVSWNNFCGDPNDPDEYICDVTLQCELVPEFARTQCLCPDFSTYYPSHGVCIHDDAVVDLSRHAPCDDDYLSASGRICDVMHDCASCPERNATNTCQGIPQGEVNSFCTSQEQCSYSVPNSYCDFPYSTCGIGVCSCFPGFYHHALTGSCDMMSSMDGFCHKDADCLSTTSGAECGVSGRCSCVSEEDRVQEVDGFDYCFLKNAGEECLTDEDCLTHNVNPTLGVCTVDNRCGCLAGYERDGETCGPVSHGGICAGPDLSWEMVCEVPTNCTAEDDGSLESRCQCPPSTMYSTEHATCVNDDVNARVDLGVYEPCDPDYLTGLSRCRADLLCTQCLGMEEYLCHQDPVTGGGRALKSSYIWLLFLLMIMRFLKE